MELLKIGDKLYFREYYRWTSSVAYKFATVERLTKTQAILSNGIKLINKPQKCRYDNSVGYPVFGNMLSKWHIETEEILLEDKKEREIKFINSWFGNKKFTNEEKRIIYLKLKELDLLGLSDMQNIL
jgi:hypothetical protein